MAMMAMVSARLTQIFLFMGNEGMEPLLVFLIRGKPRVDALVLLL